MKIILNIIAFLFAVNSLAQETLPQNIIDTLYTKALQQRFDLQLSSGYKYFDMQNQTDAPQKVLPESPIKIRSQKELTEISRKEKKELTVYTIEYYVVNKDTVDINFGEYRLKALKRKQKHSPLAEISECNLGKKEPDIRFTWIDNRWKVIKSKFIKE
ncbi:hypothetical protein HYN48_14030 [Flavobacterium magnum]|uniref:DUF4348 domain-containing protein n=1 Tax=Flavobacterium magnum TaxID=2162713 RepID=A0A2S0RIS6_9FLAO|nr:hypothetical protein [Flavobacterium magnum]AWA31118.1 hypothetical protein HYN48_14030 [Flavobacterium magnum]